MKKEKKVERLVKKAQAGSKDALAKLYEMYYDKLLYFVYSRTGDYQQSLDITGATFLSLVENLHNYRHQSSFKNYMFGIVKNKIRDYIRSKYQGNAYIVESNLAEGFFDTVVDDSVESEVSVEHKNKLQRALDSILQKIQPRYAKVLDLRFNQKASVEEAADILGVTPNNLKVMQHRAMKSAKKAWEGYSHEDQQKYID